jgi:hypothetical protein
MSIQDTLFIGPHDPNPTKLPLPAILDHYAVIRDSIAGMGHVESKALQTLVANTSFVYAFNAYKAISLLLPELYYESGAVILRQLWEVSLNLHWVGNDPVTRSQDFCNFTVMEYRQFLQKSGALAELDDFDKATDSFQSTFRYRDGRGRNRTHGNFATTSILDRAVELGDPWKREYELVYHLTSLHAHGAPGAVLHGIFQQQYSTPETREANSAAIIACLAIEVMVRDVQLLVRLTVIPDASDALEAYGRFRSTLAEIGPTTHEGEVSP